MTGATSSNCYVIFLWCFIKGVNILSLLTFFHYSKSDSRSPNGPWNALKCIRALITLLYLATHLAILKCSDTIRILTFFLRANKNITLTLSWNVVPNAGILPLVAGNGHVSLPFPDTYETTRSYWDRVYTYHTTYICPYSFESFWFVIKVKIGISAFEFFLPNLYLHIESGMNIWRLWRPAGNHYLG